MSMGILEAYKLKNGPIQSLAKLSQDQIMRMAQSGDIKPTELPLVLNEKARMIQEAANRQAAAQGQQGSVTERNMMINAQADAQAQQEAQAQQMQLASLAQQPRESGIANLPISENMYGGGGVDGYAGGGIVAFDDGGKVEHYQAGGLRSPIGRWWETFTGSLTTPTPEQLIYKELERNALKPWEAVSDEEYARRTRRQQELQGQLKQIEQAAKDPTKMPADVASGKFADDALKQAGISYTTPAPAVQPRTPAAPKEVAPPAAPSVEKPSLQDFYTERKLLMPAGEAYADTEKEIVSEREARKKEKSELGWLRLAEMGFGMAGGESPYFAVNVGKAGASALKNYADDLKEQKKLDREDRKFLAEIKQARRAEEIGNIDKATTSYQNALKNLSDEKRTNIMAQAELRGREIAASAYRQPAPEMQMYQLWASQQPPKADKSLARYRREMGELTAETKDPLLAGLRQRMQGVGKGGLNLSPEDAALLNKYLPR